jgi:hypothetical protein
LGASKVQQTLVAGRIGGHGHLPEQATDCGNGRCGQGIAVGVDADDAVDLVGQHGHDKAPSWVDSLMPAWRNTARRTCDG